MKSQQVKPDPHGFCLDEHVKDPLDYIQIDYERWRLDAVEWGINTAEIGSLRRLTPEVFRADRNSEWHVKCDVDFLVNDATPSDAKHCLDRAIAIILKKQEHHRTSKSREKGGQSLNLPMVYLGDKVYKMASVDSDVVHVVLENFEYRISDFISGFSDGQTFFRIVGWSKETDERDFPKEWAVGFLHVRPEGPVPNQRSRGEK